MKDTVVEQVPIKSIIVEGRYREDLGDLSELVQSIKDKGIIQPITVDTNYKLLAGGRRLESARQAGLEVIPVIVRRTHGDLDALEIELFENIYRKDMTWPERAKLEKAIFDMKKAADPKWSQQKQAEATNSSDSGVNRRLQLAAYVEAIPELKDMKSEDEAWKAVKKLEERALTEVLVERAKASGLKGLKIAEKNFKIGDAIGGVAALKDGLYRFADVDPPYAVELDRRKSRNENDDKLGNYHEWTPEQYSKNIQELASEVYRVMADHSFCIWWFGMSWYNDTLAILRDVGFKVNDIPAIWYKGIQGQTASPDTMLGSSYEPFFVCRKGDAKLRKSGRSNVFHFAPVPPSKKIHPTEKPLELMVELLETFCFPGSRIVVPFLGSGVTIRSAFVTGNIAFGWDLSETHKEKFLGRVREDIEAGLYEDTGEPRKDRVPPKEL